MHISRLFGSALAINEVRSQSVPCYAIVPATQQLQYFTCRISMLVEKNRAQPKCHGEWRMFFFSRFAFYTCNNSCNRESWLFVQNPNADFVLIFSSTPPNQVNFYPRYIAILNKVHIIPTQCVQPSRQYISRYLTTTNASSIFDNKSVNNYRSVQSR